jgi:hypothetical protein
MEAVVVSLIEWAVLIHLSQVDIHLTKSSREGKKRGKKLLHLFVQYLTT